MTTMAGYCRVSTQRQVEKWDSLAVQEKRLREEAKKQGWTLVLYVEPGITAKDDHRPQYQKMRADLEAGTVTGLVATKYDRVWRSLALAVNEIKTFTQKWGRDLFLLDDKADTKTASGRLAMHTILSVGEFERDRLAERVREVALYRAEKGLWNGGTYPFGFTRGQAKGTLAVAPKAAEVVRRLFRLYLDKRAIRRVVHILNADGVKAPTGGQWSVKTVRGILRNPTYSGRLVYNKWAKHTGNGKAVRRDAAEQVGKDGAVPALIPRATWEAVQKMLKAGSLLHPRAIASDYLLSGLCVCGRCGAAMTGYSVPGGPGRTRRYYKYYRCWKGFDQGKQACRGNLVRADALERTVLEVLFDLRTNPAKLRTYMKQQRVREREEVGPLKQKVGRLEADRQKMESREDQIKLAFEEKAYSLKEMKRRLAVLAEDKERTEAALATAKAQLGSATLETFDPEHVVQALETAWDIYEELPFEDQRSLLHNLIGEVRVTRDGGPPSQRKRLLGSLSHDWRERVDHNDEVIPCEIELWFRNDPRRRTAARDRVVNLVGRIGGQLLQEATVPEIGIWG